MEVSNLFVVVMGMGTTFAGLICIILLTNLLGWVMEKFDKHKPPEQPPAAAIAASTPRAPGLPADGIEKEVKVAIIAALMQMPGFRMENVTSIVIRRA